MLENFKECVRKPSVSSMHELTQADIDAGLDPTISISKADLQNGSPLVGDMISRNPDDTTDMWLVAKKYYQDNFIIT